MDDLSSLNITFTTSTPDLPPKLLLIPHPSIPDDYILQIDNTSLETFNTCARASENRLVWARGGDKSTALNAGGALHAGLETWYKTFSLDSALQSILSHFEKSPNLREDWRNPDRVIDTMEKYAKKYANDYLVPQKDGVEIRFAVPLCTIPLNATIPYAKKQLVQGEEEDTSPFFISTIHVEWTGRIDLIADSGLNLTQVDHKTASMMGQNYFDQYELSQQMIGYNWAGRKSGWPIASTTINVIYWTRPGRTHVNGRTEFHRQEFFYSDAKIDEWEYNTTMLVADFLTRLANGYFTKMTAWCHGKFGRCPYWNNCLIDDREQRHSNLFSSDFANVTWNPLDED